MKQNYKLLDDGLRNVIDRTAFFVAKNGREFEERTREKQYGDPRFGFLFGREYADYYRFRVMREIQKRKAFGFLDNFYKYFQTRIKVKLLLEKKS